MKSWKDITLRKAQKLESLPKGLDTLDLIINQFSILKDMEINEVERFTPNELVEKANELEFLKELPLPKKVDKVKVNGRKYKLIDFTKMSLGQMVDIEEYYNEGLVDNAHRILSVMFLPTKRKFPYLKETTIPYEPDEVRENDMLDCDMETIWGTLLFFYLGEMKYTKDLLGYLEGTVQMRKEELNQLKEMVKENQ
jgi:hypothetical protein